MIDIIRSNYINLYEIMCIYEAKNSKRGSKNLFKQPFLTQLKFCGILASRNIHIEFLIR